jgi:hypothetical protein
MARRYVGINCDQCGRFVGKDGYIATDRMESTGETVVDYALCGNCRREQEVMPT